MRHPVSTPGCFEEELSGAMLGRVVRFAISPSSPDDAQPSAGEDSHGVRMVATSGFGLGIDAGGPSVGVSGVVGHAGDGGAQAVIASPSEGNGLGLAGLVGHWCDTGLGGQVLIAD